MTTKKDKEHGKNKAAATGNDDIINHIVFYLCYTY